MSPRLAAAPASYAKAVFDGWRARFEEAIARSHAKGEDIEVGQTRDGAGGIVSCRVILRDRVSGARYALVIDAGTLSIEAL